jgi:hypothetical protein
LYVKQTSVNQSTGNWYGAWQQLMVDMVITCIEDRQKWIMTSPFSIFIINIITSIFIFLPIPKSKKKEKTYTVVIDSLVFYQRF